MVDAICRPPYFGRNDLDLLPFDLNFALPVTVLLMPVTTRLSLNVVRFSVLELTGSLGQQTDVRGVR